MDDTTDLALGPPVLGIRLSSDATVSGDGWLVRQVTFPPGLDGPPGILQGGFAAAVTSAIARSVDRFGAPLTSVDARLHAPTPLGRPLQARIRAADEVANYVVELRDGETLLVSSEVELAGHDPAARVADLAELAGVPLPDARPQHVFATCWVCGADPTHPYAQRLHPRPRTNTTSVIPWVANEELGDERGVIDPMVVAAVLDCPTQWAGMPYALERGHAGLLLASYQFMTFHDAPVMEPLRTVARVDATDGRKVWARGALVDDDGVVYATVSALQIAVAEVPSLV